MTTPNTEELRMLLENAAKACGFAFDPTVSGNYLIGCFEGAAAQDRITWEPHLPGLDSQVLAAELGIDTDWFEGRVRCSGGGKLAAEYYTDHASKAHAQAMAVLRVAAAIGEAMP